MHEVLVNRLGGLSLPRKSVVRLTDRPEMTLDVYRGRKTTMQQQQQQAIAAIAVQLYTVIQEVCRWLTNEKQRKTDIRFNRPIPRCFLKPIKVSVIIEH